MKTVIYLELVRRRKKFLAYAVLPGIIWSVLFLGLMVLGRKLPMLNETYMMWPDMVKDLLGLPGWKQDLVMNIWHILALFYPLFVGIFILAGISSSIVEEERLETVVYLRNINVSRSSIWLGKGLVWMFVSFVSQGVLALVQVIQLQLTQMNRYVSIVSRYYGLLCLIGLFYLALGLFAASYKKCEEDCENTAWCLVLIPWLVSRIPALLQFLSALLVSAGREGKLSDVFLVWGIKLEPLSMVCPLTWCWGTVGIAGKAVWIAAVIAVLLGGAGFSIYRARR